MHLLAFKFILGHFTVRKDIVSKVQAIIKSSLQESAEQGAASVMTDLWSDNVSQREQYGRSKANDVCLHFFSLIVDHIRSDLVLT